MNTCSMMNMGGMGNPALMEMQAGMGMGIGGWDGATQPPARPATSCSRRWGRASARSQGGPSFEAALDEAVQDAGKEVVDP